ncbi:MAG: aminodeoxychorismate synthase component I [Halieaceae bacterium]|jgi:para-aminobenzoate synthetase component 1|nr:aminodeoxychorismate synthase component I [Halieaceae bacterium]
MSKAVHLDDIPYQRDTCELFERIRDLPGAALLDSSFPYSTAGRYDILAANPVAQLPSLQQDADEAQCRAFFEDLGRYHRDRFAGIQPVSQDIPFCGGILGYLSYGLGNRLHRVVAGAGMKDSGPQPPASLMQAYDWCVIQDHLLRKATLVSQPGVPAAERNDVLARLRQGARNRTPDFRLDESFRSNMTPETYRAAFERIADYIRAGDCYQVNLAQRFSAAFSGDPWYAYRQLRAVAAAPLSAYLKVARDSAVISLSPERFLSLHGHRVETAPIKGTRPRHADPEADRAAVRELRASSKDRAENLMIVDLLRNDLGRSCVPGSIIVDRLFEVQSLATVHHLVSTISGELQPGRGAVELLRDSFPGGSITGAPKRRAMEIIAELEPDPRHVYCGSVLYISADGRMDSNIAIRTLLSEGGNIHCWAGGGIVADSQWEQEYQETFDKVGKFLTALEAMGRA